MRNSTQNGLINIDSPYSVSTTTDRLYNVLNNIGMQVIARVNHAQAAAKLGMELRPTELLIFGNPQAGTPFMQSCQAAAIDFPQKALVWQDDNDKVRISFNDPGYLIKRHGIENMDELAHRMKAVLEGYASAVTAA